MPRRKASRKMSRSSVTASRSKLRSRAYVTASRALSSGVSGLRSSVWPWTRWPCFGDDLIGLIAELSRNLPVRRQHFGGGVDLFLVAGGVRGNLRSLWTLIAGSFKVLTYLLAARD